MTIKKEYSKGYGDRYPNEFTSGKCIWDACEAFKALHGIPPTDKYLKDLNLTYKNKKGLSKSVNPNNVLIELNSYKIFTTSKSNQIFSVPISPIILNMTTPISSPLNQILFGPPGTGKTYNTINKALEVLDPEFLSVNSEDRLALKNRFDDFIEDERIVFCTFHQSFSYEDFIEGLRASSIDGQIEYRVESGVFKKICERATWISNKDLMGKDFSYEASIDDALDKFVTRVSVRPIILETQSGLLFHVNYVGWDKRLYCTTQNNIIKLSVDNLRKILNGIESVLESSTDTPFTSRIVEYIKEKLLDNGGALDNSSLIFGTKKPYVLIIDEINRGNISKIFGELITLIEPSKRAGQDEALSVILAYSKEFFSVPDNVYLIGTMNTADRSLASLDIALRRRFEFVEMPPRPDLLDNKIISGVNIGELLKVMNERIEILLGREHCLGHAYFMALPENARVEDLADIFRRQIIPLLQEYFFEDWQRISWVLNDPRKILVNRFLVQSQSNVLQLFGDEVGSALQDNRWLISKEAFERIEAYAGVINHEAKITALVVGRGVINHEAKTTALVVGRQVFFMGHTVRQLESGTIELLNGEEIITPVMPKLKEMAESLSIGILNGQDQPYNTRQLGKVIIDAVEALV